MDKLGLVFFLLSWHLLVFLTCDFYDNQVILYFPDNYSRYTFKE